MNQELAELLKQCTVKLSLAGKSGWGTGFCVTQDLILTCAHVVKEAGFNPVNVSFQNQEKSITALTEQLLLDPFDLALLRLQPNSYASNCVYLDVDLKPGDSLYAFGYPDDFSNGAPVTFLCEGLTGDDPPLIKFKSGQARPGLSGSPLLNMRTGKVCGIVKFTRDRSTDIGGGGILITTVLAEFLKLKELQQEFHTKNNTWNSLLIGVLENHVQSNSSRFNGLNFKKLINEPVSLVGCQLGSCTLQEFIGAGGSGLVYRAWNSRFNQTVCIKILYPLKADVATHISKIINRSSKGLYSLNNPFLVKIFDFERLDLMDQSSFFFLMEYIDGKTLDDWNHQISQDKSAFARRLELALNLAVGLKAAHECKYIDDVGIEQTGVLHGDIKPANIIVRPDGSPCLIDFMMVDIHRLLDPKVVPSYLLDKSISITAALGTPGFMAPEQQSQGIITVKSDIYSLGITFFGLFFPNSSPYELYQFLASEPNSNVQLKWIHRFFNQNNKQDPNALLRRLLKSMLESNSVVRVSSMQQVIEGLTKIAQAAQIELTKASY